MEASQGDQNAGISRRSFLSLSAIGAASLLTGACAGDGGNLGTVDLTTPLHLPPILTPSVDEMGRHHFQVTVQKGRSALLPGAPTSTLGFNGPYLGPTVRMARGDDVTMHVVNKLNTTTAVHWHGMHLPAVSDGGPHQPIAPGATWLPSWTVDQPAATLWYHPHPHGDTADQTYRGLGGIIIVEDEWSTDSVLPHTYGVDDFPIIIQDKHLTDDGRLVTDSSDYGDIGQTILVNGTYGPCLSVGVERIRLRVLNASNARIYNLGFKDGGSFHIIAGDAGLLHQPVEVARVTLSPAERCEILVDLVAGRPRTLRSFPGDVQLSDGTFDILGLQPVNQLAPAERLPTELPAPPSLRAADRAVERHFYLSGGNAINRRTMDMSRVDIVAPADAVEVWSVNYRFDLHNFHIHGASFSILDIGGEPPPAHLAGLKDTVFFPPRVTTRLAVRMPGFVDSRVPYMYHCHILRHEDAGMMGQYIVTDSGVQVEPHRLQPPGEEGHHH